MRDDFWCFTPLKMRLLVFKGNYGRQVDSKGHHHRQNQESLKIHFPSTSGQSQNSLWFSPYSEMGKKTPKEKIFSWHGPLIVNYEPYHGIKSKGVVPPIMSIRRKCLFEIILDYWDAAFQTLHCITINMCLLSCAVHRLN